MLRSIFSISALLIASLVSSQNVEVIEELLSMDTVPKFSVRSVGLHYNALKLVESAVNNELTGQELQAELGISKLFLIFDFGRASTSRGKEYEYNSTGNYWRAGVDFNMSKAWQDGNMIGLGLRYCRANFDDDVEYSLDGLTQETIILRNSNQQAQWGELIFKIRRSNGKQCFCWIYNEIPVFSVD